MRNCFFEDNDFSTNVRPVSFIQKDSKGYFIEVRINRKDVVKFMEMGVPPKYDEDDDIFTIQIGLNNSTNIHINGIRTMSLSDNRLQKIPVSLISIRELALKLYSKNTKYKNQKCYATKAIFHIQIPSRRKYNVNS